MACITRLFDANASTPTAAGPSGTCSGGRCLQPTSHGTYFGQPRAWGHAGALRSRDSDVDQSVGGGHRVLSRRNAGVRVCRRLRLLRRASLYYSTRVKDEWTPVVAAPFVSDFVYSNEPVFSADGKTLTFTGRKSTGTQDLWTVRYADRTWGTPVALPSPINSDGVEFRGSYMPDGTLYFTSARSGIYQVYEAHSDPSRRVVVKLVGPPVSTNSYEGDPCIAPDGRFLIFNSARDGKSADLFVTFRDARGGWGTPINLGPAFNGPDRRVRGPPVRLTASTCSSRATRPQRNTIFWVAVSAIDKLARGEDTIAGYLAQPPPDGTPRVFGLEAHDGYFPSDRIAVSPDGKETLLHRGHQHVERLQHQVLQVLRRHMEWAARSLRRLPGAGAFSRQQDDVLREVQRCQDVLALEAD